jgi:hypothetical protein
MHHPSAGQQERPGGPAEHPGSGSYIRRLWRWTERREGTESPCRGGRRNRMGFAIEHVLRQEQRDRPGPASRRGPERLAHQARH